MRRMVGVLAGTLSFCETGEKRRRGGISGPDDVTSVSRVDMRPRPSVAAALHDDSHM